MINLLNKKRKLFGKKGFSLVELIIVIAIMAVLIAILAPQYLKYVDKSRQSADDTTADEMLRATQIAMSDEDIAQAVGDAGSDIIITFDADGVTFTDPTTGTLLQNELDSTLGDGWTDKEVTSSAYKNDATLNHQVFTITITAADGSVTGAWDAAA